MWVSTTVEDVRKRIATFGGKVALVPTMGALHDGHVSLIHRARELAPNVVVSVFVNPTQFAPGEDFERYPRPVDDDLAACEAAGAHGVFNPSVDAMYPPGVPACDINVPMIAGVLEGEHRPDHFGGVCRVVAKLFNIVQPQIACFGMKDYQQLRVIEAMTADLAMPIDIAPCPIIREDDGLARSSRNVYLTADERPHAVGLYKALCEAKLLVDRGELDPAIVEAAMKQVLKAHHLGTDYAVVRHSMTLQPIDTIDTASAYAPVALIAARLGSVRLIDNMELR